MGTNFWKHVDDTGRHLTTQDEFFDAMENLNGAALNMYTVILVGAAAAQYTVLPLERKVLNCIGCAATPVLTSYE